MRILFSVASLVLALGGFCLGSHWAGWAPRSPAADLPVEWRQDIAELTVATAEMRKNLAWVSARLGALSLAGRVESVPLPAAPSCPPLDPRETTAVPPAEAAQEARTRGDEGFRQGEAIVAGSLSRGAWTGGDIEQMRTLQRAAPGPQWIFLMQEIDAAITSGKLQPDAELSSWH